MANEQIGFGDGYGRYTGTLWCYQREGQTATGGIRVECGRFEAGVSNNYGCSTHLKRLFCAIGFMDDSNCATETFGMVHAKSICIGATTGENQQSGNIIEWSYADATNAYSHVNYIAFGE